MNKEAFLLGFKEAADDNKLLGALLASGIGGTGGYLLGRDKDPKKDRGLSYGLTGALGGGILGYGLAPNDPIPNPRPNFPRPESPMDPYYKPDAPTDIKPTPALGTSQEARTLGTKAKDLALYGGVPMAAGSVALKGLNVTVDGGKGLGIFESDELFKKLKGQLNLPGSLDLIREAKYPTAYFDKSMTTSGHGAVNFPKYQAAEILAHEMGHAKMDAHGGLAQLGQTKPMRLIGLSGIGSMGAGFLAGKNSDSDIDAALKGSLGGIAANSPILANEWNATRLGNKALQGLGHTPNKGLGRAALLTYLLGSAVPGATSSMVTRRMNLPYETSQ